ncbi:MAG TPA: M24 family metallopeptidase [Chloroflexota bacterium]|nr:M24 family metallopeptidase [Chloroflexota bacterium]
MAQRIDIPRLSLQERDHRWGRVRQAMKERGLACIISPPNTGHWELFQADTRYLTSIGGNCSETACVFPLEGDPMAVVLNRPEFWAGAQDWVTDIRTPKHHTWSIPMLDRIRELGLESERIGVVGLGGGVRTPEGTISWGLYERIREGLPKAGFEDVTVMMGNLRSVKSQEELACMERATAIVEHGIRVMSEVATPGARDFEVYAEVYGAMMKAGSEVPIMVLWGSGPGEARDAFLPTHRRLEKGDRLDNEIEAKYLGYQAQRVQPAVLGDPPAAVLDAMNQHRSIFAATQAQLKPGVPFGDIARVIDQVAAEAGCEVRLTMHGRGLGEDRPLLVGGDMTEETAGFVLQEGNTFIMKPRVRTAHGAAVTWGDIVTVTPQGGRRLGKGAHELLVIPC